MAKDVYIVYSNSEMFKKEEKRRKLCSVTHTETIEGKVHVETVSSHNRMMKIRYCCKFTTYQQQRASPWSHLHHKNLPQN